MIEQHFGASRFIYNQALECKKWFWEEYKQNVSTYGMDKVLNNEMKPKQVWLKEVYGKALQSSLRNLDKAYSNFFRGLKKGQNVGFPKFKSKKDSRQSYQYPTGTKVKLNRVSIPKIGWIKARTERLPEGKLKTTTVKRVPSGKYFISVLAEDGFEVTAKAQTTEAKTIGIDLGLKEFAILSSGEKIDNPKFAKKAKKKIKHHQRALSRKKKGGKNREQARRRFAIAHEKVANQRKDFLHKASSQIVYDSQVNTIVMEDLNIKGMVKNHNMAGAVSDGGWGEFVRQIKYKCEWSGKNFVQIDRWFPSSKMCSVCGQIKDDLTLADREYICDCGNKINRDLNAAINIKNEGLNKLLIPEERDVRINKDSTSDGPIRVFEKTLASTSDELSNVELAMVC
jgi:putative transposase